MSRKPLNHIWVAVLVATGASLLLIAPIAALFLYLGHEVKSSPGYALAVSEVETHPGVVRLLGPPVRVVATTGHFYTVSSSGDQLKVTFKLQGAAGTGRATVVTREAGGSWLIEQATLDSAHGSHDLLAAGELSVRPRSLARSP